MLFLDSASLRTCDSVANIGTCLVIIGVALEGCELAIKSAKLAKKRSENIRRLLSKLNFVRKILGWCERRWLVTPRFNKCLERCEKYELEIDVSGWFWLAMVVLGLMMELAGSSKATDIRDAANAKLQERAGIANKLAGEAIERASSNDLAVAKANERAEKEARARVELESDVITVMSPRLLVQTGEAIERLSQISNVTAIVHVSTHNWLEGESSRTASQILDFLSRAHWNPIITNIPTEWAWPPRSAGLDVQVNERPMYDLKNVTAAETDLTKRAIQARDVLVRELNAGGIEAEASLSRMKLPSGIVLIVVGERWNPFQYRFVEQMFERKANALEQVNPVEARRLRGIAESLKESDRRQRPSPELMTVREKQRELRDQEQEIGDRISKLESKQFPIASKELAQAQIEYSALRARMNQLQDEESALSRQEFDLDMERSFGTNFTRRQLRTNTPPPLRK